MKSIRLLLIACTVGLAHAQPAVQQPVQQSAQTPAATTASPPVQAPPRPQPAEVRRALEQVIDLEARAAGLEGVRDRTVRSTLARVMLHPAMVDRVGALAAEAPPQDLKAWSDLGFQAMTATLKKGGRLLSNADALEVARLEQRMMEAMTDYECAQSFKHQRTDAQGKGRSSLRIANTFESPAFERHLGLIERATALAESGQDESRALTRAEMAAALDEYRRGLAIAYLQSPATFQFLKEGRTLEQASDREVCGFGRALMGVVLAGDRAAAENRVRFQLSGAAD